MKVLPLSRVVEYYVLLCNRPYCIIHVFFPTATKLMKAVCNGMEVQPSCHFMADGTVYKTYAGTFVPV